MAGEGISAIPHVLVADADRSVRTRYHEQFQSIGWTVTEAPDGHEALVHALIQPPTLVVADCHLPIVDGIAVSDILRRDDTTRNVPVLVLAQDASTEGAQRARRAGVRVVLPKSASLDQMLEHWRRMQHAVRATREHASKLRDDATDLRAAAAGLRASSALVRSNSAALRVHSARLREQCKQSQVRAEPMRNALLAQLSEADLAYLCPRLRSTSFPLRHVIQRQDQELNVVHFPTNGLVSSALALGDGNMIGAATVGNDGVVGIEASWSDQCVSVHDMVVQVAPLQTHQIEVGEFRRALRACSTLHDLIARYVQRLHYINARLLACTAHHSIEQRCARWLLAMHDVADTHGLQFTHDGMVGMLGVRRQSVSGVATAFQAAGFIRHRYGVMTIVNRPALEAASCGCYAAIRRASATITI